MNALHLLASIPLWVWIVLLTQLAVPGLSALLTAAPKFLTGFLTMVLSIVTSVLGDLIHASSTNGSFSWAQSFGAGLLAWFTASQIHSKMYAGSGLEKRLHDGGLKL